MDCGTDCRQARWAVGWRGWRRSDLHEKAPEKKEGAKIALKPLGWEGGAAIA